MKLSHLLKWNENGNWLLTASRDHLLKIFDIRNTKEELQTFRGHKKEVATAAWHPVHEGNFFVQKCFFDLYFIYFIYFTF